MPRLGFTLVAMLMIYLSWAWVKVKDFPLCLCCVISKINVQPGEALKWGTSLLSPSRHHQGGPVEPAARPLPDGRTGGHSGRHADGGLPHGHAAHPAAQVRPSLGRAVFPTHLTTSDDSEDISEFPRREQKSLWVRLDRIRRSGSADVTAADCSSRICRIYQVLTRQHRNTKQNRGDLSIIYYLSPSARQDTSTMHW